MKKAFVLMAYKNPEQIERLVKRMKHPSFHFYIHVDKKWDKGPFEYLAGFENVYMTKVHNRVNWASFGFTKTLIQCIEEVLSSNHEYDFVSSFSGQDYPIKPNEHIADYYQANLGKSFFSLVDLSSEWMEESRQRYEKYHMTNYNFRGRYVIQSILNSTLPKRKFDFFEEIHGGPRATWWTMSRDCAHYVIDFFNTHKKLRRFTNFTWAPDEFLIPSIIMNSSFHDSIINDSGRYIDWSLGGANPKVLTIDDLKSLKKSDKLFARKFDIKVDTKILDALDEEFHTEVSK